VTRRQKAPREGARYKEIITVEANLMSTLNSNFTPSIGIL
jgi:hypothetical protein